MSYFNILNIPEKNHEKIQPLSNFFEVQLYYRVKNNKNLKLDG